MAKGTGGATRLNARPRLDTDQMLSPGAFLAKLKYLNDLHSLCARCSVYATVNSRQFYRIQLNTLVMGYTRRSVAF